MHSPESNVGQGSAPSTDTYQSPAHLSMRASYMVIITQDADDFKIQGSLYYSVDRKGDHTF